MLISRACSLVLVLWLSGVVCANDWPMWRYDAYRSAASPAPLPQGKLQLSWTRAFSPRKPAWDDTLNRDLMSYDRAFEPIVKDGRMFIGFNDSDKLEAYDLASGGLLWSYFCDGPVRLAPVAWENLVYCASDDGCLHCLNAETGQLQWKFRGGPLPASHTDVSGLGRLSLGNSRLISAWPMRGGPVMCDGQLYIAASIWPFMGTFIYALDARSGRVVWCNDETGAQYIRQPHSAPAFAGVAPQGALVATRDSLIIPGGRSVPAVLDRATGKLKYFELNAGGKGTGGSFVAANDQAWFVHTRDRGTREFSLTTGLKTAFTPNEPVLAGDVIYAGQLDAGMQVLRAFKSESKEQLWQVPIDVSGDLVKVGKHLIGAAKNHAGSIIQILQLSDDPVQPCKLSDQLEVSGHVVRLLVANEHLLAVTLEGSIHALTFGPSAAKSAASSTLPAVVVSTNDQHATNQLLTKLDTRVAELIKRVPPQGFAVLLGGDDQALVDSFIQQSFVEASLFEPSATRVDQLRVELDKVGRYGPVTVHHSSLDDLYLPPYFAHHILISPAQTAILTRRADLLEKLYQSVRPYGGLLSLMTTDPNSVKNHIGAAHLVNAKIEIIDGCVIVQREGALPGSGTWTHQYGNIANTIKSDDQLVKLPLGVLWYGGVSHEDVLPRHGHGPPEQVVGGRLFIEGINTLTARDVYTGRVLWQRKFSDLGTHDVYFDDSYKETPLDPAYNQNHIPGANGRGTNYVVTADRIYILEKSTCHVLDTDTGQNVMDIELPQADPSSPHEWGYIGVFDDVLIGGVGFAQYRARQALGEDPEKLTGNKAGFGAKSLDRAASLSLVAFDRHTGKKLWQVPALHSFWHNGIVAGNGKIFALDRNPKPVEEFLKRRGKANPKSYRIIALDAHSGDVKWEKAGSVFGSWLGYAEDKDLLLQAGASASDRLSSEIGQGMAVLSGSTGQTVWEKSDLKYSGPCVLHRDLIITNANAYTESSGAYYLSDGSQKMTKNPLTGRLEPWKITRAYGCNSIVASENLLTFRSGAAGFYDMLTEAGTGNLGGFRSGCTSNLIAADGVLNAPDYTRTCSCSYQNQTSLALVHMPGLDAWTISNSAILEPKQGRFQEVGINLGAPGDRRAPSGLMWLEYPPVSGDAPNLKITWQGSSVRLFQDHPSAQASSDVPWITSSGIEGLSSLRIETIAQPRYALKTGWPIEHVAGDAEESAQGEVDLDSSSLELVAKDKETQWIGMRFENIRLARGTAIRSAHLQLTAKAAADSKGQVKFYVESSGDAQRFTNEKHNLSMRTRSDAFVAWEVPPWKAEGNSTGDQQSPDLAGLLNTVISREDWQPGNAIVILMRGEGSHVMSAFRNNETGAAKLIVDADELELISDADRVPLPYRARLLFGLPREATEGVRDYTVTIGDQSQSIHLDAKAKRTESVTFDRVEVTNALEIKFSAGIGEPVISGVELRRLSE